MGVAVVPAEGGRGGGGGGDGKETDEDTLARKIAGVLDECQQISSNTVKIRKLKQLSTIRSSFSSSSPSTPFFPSFIRALTPLFDASRRTVSTERVVRFVSSFAIASDSPSAGLFLVEFLNFLLTASLAANKTARFRACQIVSEIIMQLPDDADVSDGVWDDIIESMIQRVGDRIPAVRIFAVRALSRFAFDVDNANIVDLFLKTLPEEQNAEVRKVIILSLPPTSDTAMAIIDRTLDVSESVRKTSYSAISSKFPLQSLSIKLRATILQRGLSDRSPSVKKECLKMLKEEWLANSCNGDLIELLRFLDVETYESTGVTIVNELLQSGMVQDIGINGVKQIISVASHASDGQSGSDVNRLIEPEGALFWRILCRHLQVEAQAKGSVAATTMGAEAGVYASQASVSNDLLEDVLPVTVSDYVELVKTHLLAGPNYRFVSRQLLLLGAMFDFSDFTNRNVGCIFVHELLHHSLEHETDDDGNEIIIGNGINLGGDHEWAKAVSELAKNVHASAGEFEEKVSLVIDELARPCRERTADFLQWMNCLSVVGFLLENITSFRYLLGKVMEPTEILHSLLVAGAKNIHADVRRVAVRCLGLYGLLERKPSEVIVKQLRLSLISGPPSVNVMACKALFDLAAWHGIHELDAAISLEETHVCGEKNSFISVDLNANEDLPVGLLDLLYSVLDRNELAQGSELNDDTIEGTLGEGFAKLLLLSDRYPSLSSSLHHILLGKLIKIYFNSECMSLERLKQCLSVFFENYPAISSSHKRCISRGFIPIMRSTWPSIHGNHGGSTVVLSKMRKLAIQAAHFMVQMMQTPSQSQESQSTMNSHVNQCSATLSSPDNDIDSADEGLALRIAVEVAHCSSVNKTADGKAYMLALCKMVTLLNFRPTQQEAIKCMHSLLKYMVESVIEDKEAIKNLTLMVNHLKALDKQPDNVLSKEEIIDFVDKKLGLEINLENISRAPCTPAPSLSRAAPSKRRQNQDSASDEEEAYNTPAFLVTPATICTRSQPHRASKTVARSQMTWKNAVIPECEDDENSDMTSEEEDSD